MLAHHKIRVSRPCAKSSHSSVSGPYPWLIVYPLTLLVAQPPQAYHGGGGMTGQLKKVEGRHYCGCTASCGDTHAPCKLKSHRGGQESHIFAGAQLLESGAIPGTYLSLRDSRSH